MTALEICLILIGIGAIVVSCFISEKASQERMERAAKELVLGEEAKEALKKQTREAVEGILADMTDDIAGKAERELEKLSNEKIMAVHDYADTVLEKIHKNHSEVMFLYSMLDDKEKEVKGTVRTIQDTVKAARQLEEKRKQDGWRALENQEQEALDGQAAMPAEEMLKSTETEVQEGMPTPEELKALAGEAEEGAVNSNEKILRLYAEGKTNLQIAKELGLGIGEVKLVIDLYKEGME